MKVRYQAAEGGLPDMAGIGGKDAIPITMLEAVDEVDAGDVFLEDEIASMALSLLMSFGRSSSTFDLCDRYDNPMDFGNVSKANGRFLLLCSQAPFDRKLDLV